VGSTNTELPTLAFVPQHSIYRRLCVRCLLVCIAPRVSLALTSPTVHRHYIPVGPSVNCHHLPRLRSLALLSQTCPTVTTYYSYLYVALAILNITPSHHASYLPSVTYLNMVQMVQITLHGQVANSVTVGGANFSPVPL
jgi:hypothetical protein